MQKKLICSECGKETETLMAKRCLKCNNQEMRKKFSEKYFHPKRKPSNPIFPKERKKCARCGTHCYGTYCWQCLNKIKRERMENSFKNDNSFEPTIGLCKICGKEIKGRQGTFLEGKGSCHKECAKAKQKMEELKCNNKQKKS